MRNVGLRRFPGGYQGSGRSRKPYTLGPGPGSVASARTLLAVLGLGFALGGVGIAWAVDRLVGMFMLVVGAFLLILPFTRPHGDE